MTSCKCINLEIERTKFLWDILGNKTKILTKWYNEFNICLRQSEHENIIMVSESNHDSLLRKPVLSFACIQSDIKQYAPNHP